VLDIGAGAGADSLIAARRAGPDGRVVALDLTPAMTRKLKTGAGDAGIHVIQASAEDLPLADESFDCITSNGALNLVPDKRRAVAEMFRVLRPGGRLQFADVVIHRPVTADCSEDPRLWVECVVGATVDEELLALFRESGFQDVRVVGTRDYFAHSPSAQTREIAASFGARSMELAMRRGERAPGALRRWLHRLDPRRGLVRLWRGGLVGAVGLILALAACYGTLAALGLLAAVGLGRPNPDETLWAGAIALFTALTAAAMAFGAHRHRIPGPPLLGVAGAAVVLFALFVHYHMFIEGAGFVLLAAAVAWDIVLRRREQARVLGVSQGRHPPG
jgi:SAM-dependent methyltransferase